MCIRVRSRTCCHTLGEIPVVYLPRNHSSTSLPLPTPTPSQFICPSIFVEIAPPPGSLPDLQTGSLSTLSTFLSQCPESATPPIKKDWTRPLEPTRSAGGPVYPLWVVGTKENLCNGMLLVEALALLRSKKLTSFTHSHRSLLRGRDKSNMQGPQCRTLWKGES